MRSAGEPVARAAQRLGAPRIGVFAVGAGLLAPLLYRLGYEPYWQDELTSIAAAQGIRGHGFPVMPSGFVYWKGELYSLLVAVVGGATGDSSDALRAVSVVTYVATVLAFGLLLMPTVLPGRHRWHLATTLLFATAPQELAWARDARMYQLAQLFVILFITFFIRALRTQRTRDIALAALALVVMYLAHEETFTVLPAVPIAFLVVMRLRWIRDRRWWILGGGALAIIGGQFLLATLSHPPSLGTDPGNRPFILYDPHEPFFYVRSVLFGQVAGSLPLLSTLSVVGLVVGIVRRDRNRLILGTFLWASVIVLSLFFTLRGTRYFFTSLPFLFALGGLGAFDIVTFLRHALSAVASSVRERRAVAVMVAGAALFGLVGLMASFPRYFSDYGLAVSRVTNTPYAHRRLDYDVAGAYIASHRQPGDIVVSLCPPSEVWWYTGKAPDYIVATGPNKLLYLMVKNDAIVDTTFGAPEVLTADRLQQVMAAHRRIWLVSDLLGVPQHQVDPALSELITSSFNEVEEGRAVAVYFRGGAAGVTNPRSA